MTRTQQTPTAPPSCLPALLSLRLGQSIVLTGNSSCLPFLSSLWSKLSYCPPLARAVSIAYATPHMAPEASSYVRLSNSAAILQIPSLKHEHVALPPFAFLPSHIPLMCRPVSTLNYWVCSDYDLLCNISMSLRKFFPSLGWHSLDTSIS